MHCLTPKYQNIGSAVKNIPLKFESDLSSSSRSVINYHYYKLKQETNYDEYKLVYSIKRPTRLVYIYLQFSTNRAFSGTVNFITFLSISNPYILSQIVNETDFNINTKIECGNLKAGWSGQRVYQSSFFSNSSVAPGFQSGFTQSQNNWNPNQFGAQNQFANQNFGGINPNLNSFGSQQPQVGGFGQTLTFNSQTSGYGFQPGFNQPAFNSNPYGGNFQQQQLPSFVSNPSKKIFLKHYKIRSHN